MTRALMVNIAWTALAFALFIVALQWAPARGAVPCHGIVGEASFYGIESCVKPPPNCRTANGEKFTGNSLTAAMIPLSHIGERWRVTYIGTAKHPGTGKSVVVRINDTGDFARLGRLMDLSKRAAAVIGLIPAGVGRVCAERLS
jgi:rare lipoprotein A